MIVSFFDQIVILLLCCIIPHILGIVGKLVDASACYERAIQEQPKEMGHHKVG